MDVEMKGRMSKDASGLLENLDKGMKIEQSFRVCCFPDFIVLQSVFAKRTPSVSDLSRLYFSSHERWTSGRPPPDLCPFFLAIAQLSPQFCLHTLDIPRGLTPVLAEVPALIAVIPPLAAHVRFPSSFGGLLHRRHGWMSVLVNAAAPPRDGPAPGGKARRHA